MSDTPNKQNESSSTLYGKSDDEVIQGHKYDGIKEYDNPMPGWWVGLFWITIVFSVIYYVGITFFDFVDTYEDDLAQSQAELAEIRQAYAEANPSFTPDAATLADIAGDEAAVSAGAEHYAGLCASCHGSEGEGLIGPNLTDGYWVHGGSLTDIYEVVTDGVPAKGMPAWDGALTSEQRAQVVAYIHSLQGTDPPNAKEPEGELYEGGTGEVSAVVTGEEDEKGA